MFSYLGRLLGTQPSHIKVKVRQVDAHLPLLGGEPLTSVMHGQCDIRCMDAFPAARHHHSLAGTNYTA